MKKFLSIIAAVGLTATTSTTVVACSGKLVSKEVNTTKKITLVSAKLDQDNQTIILSGTNLDNVDSKNVIIKKHETTSKTESEILNGEFKVNDKYNTKATFKLKNILTHDVIVDIQLSNYSEAKLKDIELKVTKDETPDNKEDITNIKIKDVIVGKNMDTVNSLIQSEIDKIINGAVLNTDYTINGNTAEAGTITVTAKEQSKLITGEFTVTVDKIDIKNITIDPIDFETNMDIVKSSIQSEIDKMINGTVLDTDYIIDGNTAEAGTITVIAKEQSKLITGQFTIVVLEPVVKADISNLKMPIYSPVEVGDPMEAVEWKVSVLILRLVKGTVLNTDYTVVGDTAEPGTITVTAKEQSKLITGEFTFQVYKKNIKDIAIDSINVETNMDTVKSLIQSEIDKKINGTILNTDYTIVGNTAEPGTITVTAKEESKLITGTFTITVVKPFVKVDITNIQIEVIKVGTDMYTVKSLIQSEINKMINGTALNTDYTIAGDTAEPGTITVTAKEESKLITGGFTITVEMKDYSSEIEEIKKLTDEEISFAKEIKHKDIQDDKAEEIWQSLQEFIVYFPEKMEKAKTIENFIDIYNGLTEYEIDYMVQINDSDNFKKYIKNKLKQANDIITLFPKKDSASLNGIIASLQRNVAIDNYPLNLLSTNVLNLIVEETEFLKQ